ncbi:NrfD/PsrC family molybdoenzyme membrane anchor subunit [Anaeromyxobacter oryzisoli]|uniref:NrfD/PsrC family molybdoenzyme membrane anchor subunit n=1 Tax=Anaeromyxobacter oryzisoli TaxID=2925408 RepID=UPI001F5AF4F6|nr:NrfD/PsrC family molybdoenzyme membrane anchor subunit [Anaeromyxobacter sp. SG63]
MATASLATAQPSFFREKILLGMTAPQYLRSLLTPWNLVAAVILAVGIPILVIRFAVGLGATTNLTQTAPWGVWIGFDMMTGIVLAAGGFTIGATVQLFGLKEYHAIERPAILTAFLGYLMAVFGLLADLGRPWNIIQAIFNYGTASALFEVAWCVMLYTTVLLLEFTVPLLEWLGWTRAHGVMKKALLALTVLSVVFSTMHQSALGSLFLLAPTKLHPLWYTPYIFIFFFISAIIAGICMVVVESSISHRIFASQVKGHAADVDALTIGLGRAGALVMFAYFFLKLQGVIDGHAWGYLATGYGAWFLVEILGFVLLPSLLFAAGARNGNVRMVRVAGVIGVLGIVLNRLNVSMIAFNWNQPVRYVPSWMEIWVSVTLVTLGVLVFRWIVNRMPILRADPRFSEGH